MRLTEQEYKDMVGRKTDLDEIGKAHGLAPKTAGPNKTEAEYGNRLGFEFPEADIVFEGLTLRMQNGHKYTPDWVVKCPNGEIHCVEVKARGNSGFRHASYGRARLAFDQARIDWPFRFRWVEKHKGVWNVKEY
jgi:hypothetical protein